MLGSRLGRHLYREVVGAGREAETRRVHGGEPLQLEVKDGELLLLLRDEARARAAVAVQAADHLRAGSGLSEVKGLAIDPPAVAP